MIFCYSSLNRLRHQLKCGFLFYLLNHSLCLERPLPHFRKFRSKPYCKAHLKNSPSPRSLLWFSQVETFCAYVFTLYCSYVYQYHTAPRARDISLTIGPLPDWPRHSNKHLIINNYLPINKQQNYYNLCNLYIILCII